MEIKKGIAASPGIAIAEAFVIDSEELRVPRRAIKSSARLTEIQRVRNAFQGAIEELSDLGQAQTQSAGKIKDIFAVHLRFLRDRSLRKEITDLIQSQSVAAEFAVSEVLHKLATHFATVKDPYISERATDIRDMERRLLRQLLGRQHDDVRRLTKPVVAVARELRPTETAGFDRHFVKGIATDAGGRTSHTAIIARSLGIPAVVALEDLTRILRPGDTVIVDGHHGLVIVDPTPETLEEYRRHMAEFEALGQRLATIKGMPAVTRDGCALTLLGNIEFPEEAQVVLDKGGDGIGLYRTEFLYLNREAEPTEEEQYQAYARTVEIMNGRPVTIRTVDLGADKYIGSHRMTLEPNPFLGLRSIRYCLQNLRMFKSQLRALLRASVAGPVKVMFPLITNLQEVRQAKLILRDVMEDLDDDGVEYDRNLKVGIMIETPAAALTGATLARDVDFFSIGTNDLTQYTLAVDRGNEAVATLYSGAEPAVLRLLRTVVQDAYKSRIEVSVCGEMASEPEYIMLLLGLGIRILSVTAPMIPEIKQIIRSVTIEECNQITRKVLGMNTERQISSFLRSSARHIIPEAF